MATEFDKGLYPVFCGRVIGIPAIIEERNGVVFTLVDYVPIKNEMSEEEARRAFVSIALLGKTEDASEQLAKRAQRAVVPLRLDPYILEGSEIRARRAQMPAGVGETMVPTYEIEVIKGTSRTGGDVMASLLESRIGARHTGFRYIKILGDEEEGK